MPRFPHMPPQQAPANLSDSHFVHPPPSPRGGTRVHACPPPRPMSMPRLPPMSQGSQDHPPGSSDTGGDTVLALTRRKSGCSALHLHHHQSAVYGHGKASLASPHGLHDTTDKVQEPLIQVRQCKTNGGAERGPERQASMRSVRCMSMTRWRPVSHALLMQSTWVCRDVCGASTP